MTPGKDHSSPLKTRPLGWVLGYLFAPVSVAPLIYFRIAFGLLMFISTARFIALGWVENHFIDPLFHFRYFAFEWVPIPGPELVWGLHILMILSSMGIALGLFYRWSAAIFFVAFTWCELIDITYYLNHYYFVSLVSFLLIWVPANARFSVDVWRKPALAREKLPRWNIGIFRLQMALVYVYAGLAKINSEWLLEALPLRIWLPAHQHLPFIGSWLGLEETAYLFSWGGMLYDTFIVFFLMWRPTRWLAFAAVIGFHLMTGILFQIGVFPLVMILLSPVFFDGEWHQKWLHRVGNWLGWKNGVEPFYIPQLRIRQFILAGLGLWFVIQLAFPWRNLLYEGNPFWHEQGYRFGWRVMLVEKAGSATFYVKDPVTGREGLVNNREFLNAHQEKQMAFQPDMILQFAHFLARHYQKPGHPQPQVRVETYVTLNGRPSRLLVDPQVDLSKISDGWRPKTWLLPFEEKTRNAPIASD